MIYYSTCNKCTNTNGKIVYLLKRKIADTFVSFLTRSVLNFVVETKQPPLEGRTSYIQRGLKNGGGSKDREGHGGRYLIEYSSHDRCTMSEGNGTVRSFRCRSPHYEAFTVDYYAVSSKSTLSVPSSLFVSLFYPFAFDKYIPLFPPYLVKRTKGGHELCTRPFLIKENGDQYRCCRFNDLYRNG